MFLLIGFEIVVSVLLLVLMLNEYHGSTALSRLNVK